MSLENSNENNEILPDDSAVEETDFGRCMKTNHYKEASDSYAKAAEYHEKFIDALKAGGFSGNILGDAYDAAAYAHGLTSDYLAVAILTCAGGSDDIATILKIANILKEAETTKLESDKLSDKISKYMSQPQELDCKGELQGEYCSEGFSLQENWVIEVDGQTAFYCCIPD